MILDIITGAIANLATNPANRPVFAIGTKAYQNILADNLKNDNFVIFLDQPIKFVDNFNKDTGVLQSTTYQCMFFICRKIQMDSTGVQQQATCDIAQTIKHYFLQAIIKDERVKEITKISGAEALNVFDLNASGIVWFADIEVYNSLPNCLPANTLFPITESGS